MAAGCEDQSKLRGPPPYAGCVWVARPAAFCRDPHTRSPETQGPRAFKAKSHSRGRGFDSPRLHSRIRTPSVRPDSAATVEVAAGRVGCVVESIDGGLVAARQVAAGVHRDADAVVPHLVLHVGQTLALSDQQVA